MSQVYMPVRSGRGSPVRPWPTESLLFRVEGSRAVLARTPDFLSLAGSIPVAADQRSATWDDVLRKSRAGRAAKHA